MTEEERLSLLDDCKRAAALAELHGVTLCMECHRKTFTQIPTDTVWLMEQVNSERFRMYWQPFQWLTAEENEAIAALIAPYTKCIHVFNWKGEDMLPLSAATEEWQSYLRHFDAPRALLLEFMPKGTLEELNTEAKALMQIIGGLK